MSRNKNKNKDIEQKDNLINDMIQDDSRYK